MKNGILLLTIFSLVFTACSSDDDQITLAPVESENVANLFAPQTGGQGTEEEIGGPFTKFDIETGEITTSETEWDIAFRGTTIAVNGGEKTGTNDEPERNGDTSATIVTGTFSSIVSAEGLTFSQDSTEGFSIPTGSDNGWYNYNFMTNVVAPIPGEILVVKTRNGNYAKIEILSYYENAPAAPDGFADAARYYTFNYIYNPNQGDLSLE